MCRAAGDIARTILKKIEASHVFVADVTIITEASAPRPTPNPNVLIELGYAMHALGDRVILVWRQPMRDEHIAKIGSRL